MKLMPVLLATTLLAAAPGAGAETLPDQQAREQGVKRCGPLMKKMAEFLLKDGKHGSDATWNNKAADERMFSVLVSKGYSDGDSHVNIVVSPNAKGGCDGLYVEAFAVPQQCTIAREKLFGDWKFRGSLNDATLVLQNDSGSVDVYLTPQGEGGKICLVSKRETVYE